MSRFSCAYESCAQNLAHAFRTLGKHLECMPVRLKHHIRNGINVLKWNALMKEVTHRVNKYLFRTGPTQRLLEFFRDEAKIEAILKWVVRNSAKTFCEPL